MYVLFSECVTDLFISIKFKNARAEYSKSKCKMASSYKTVHYNISLPVLKVNYNIIMYSFV